MFSFMQINMAASSGSSQSSSTNTEGGNEEKEKDKRLFELMERLRGRTGQPRSWPDMSKALRNADKRQVSEASEKLQLQRHLVRLQQACRVSNLAMLTERLESVALQKGLRYANPMGNEAYISTDMFYVSLLLDPGGTISDAKIAHNGEPMPCPELVKAIREKGLKELSTHLDGLIALYHITGDNKQRQKCFQALQALEEDLSSLGHLQESIGPPSQLVHKSPVGLVQRRIGGCAMRLYYFAHPYDLLDPDTKSSHQLTASALFERNAGHSVSVCLEGSNGLPHKLQTMPLMLLQKQDGKSLPLFSDLSAVNSSLLPAVFILRLHKPTPLSISTIKKIQAITGMAFTAPTDTKPLLPLLISHITKEPIETCDASKGLFVTLPEQNHCYFLNGLNGGVDFHAITVSKIPFTHPTMVGKILALLRQQVLFNTLISSCIRKNPNKDLNSSLTFEVSAVSLQHIVMTFEHPLHDTIATAEFDLSDVTNVKCRICSDDESKIWKNEFSCQVLQRCLSLPVSMRAILRKASSDLDLRNAPLQQFVPLPLPVPAPLPNTTISSKGHERRLAFLEAHGYRDNRYPVPNMMMPPPEPDTRMGQMAMTMQRGDYDPRFIPPGMVGAAHDIYNTPPHIDPREKPFMEPSRAPNEILDSIKVDKISQNPMLASLLDADSGTATHDVLPSTMFSSVLDMPQQLGPTKQRRIRKRKSTNELRSPSGTGRSPKRKMSEDDMIPVTVSTPSPQASLLDPGFQRAMSMPNPVPNRHLNKLLSSEEGSCGQESHVSRLASSVDNIFKQEPVVMSMQSPLHAELPTMQPDMDVKPPKPPLLKEEVIKSEDTRRLSTASSLIELLEEPEEPYEVPSKCKDKDSGRSSLCNSACSTPVGATEKGVIGGGMPEKGGAGGGGVGCKLTSDTSVFDFKPEPMNHNMMFPVKRSMSRERESLSPGGDTSPPFPSPKTHSSSTCNSTPTQKLNAEHKKIVDLTSPEDKSRERAKLLKEKREKDEQSRPPEQKKITVKLNTKELTAKTIVKDLSTPQVTVVTEFTKIKSSKDSPKSYSKDKVCDLTSDNDAPSPLLAARPLLNTDNTKPCSPSLKIKKIRSDDSKDKKRKSSKHGISDSSKRRREESKKDKSGKKRRSYTDEGDFGSSKSPGQRYAVEKGPTTIKITKSVPSSPVKSNKFNSSQSASSSLHKNAISRPGVDRLSVPGQPRPTKYPGSAKPLARSKSESHTQLGKVDSKLIRTPTIKLKPVVIPGASSTVNVSTSSGKTPPPQSAPPVAKNPFDAALQIAKAKSMPMKARKNSLSAVIDKLKSQQVPSSVSSQSLKRDSERRDGSDRKDMSSIHAKKDPIAEKKKLEEIRKEIIRAGTKSSGNADMRPTKLAVDSSTKRADPAKKPGTPTGSSSGLKFQSNMSRNPNSSKVLSHPIPKVSGSTSNTDTSRARESPSARAPTGDNRHKSSGFPGNSSSGSSQGTLEGPLREQSENKRDYKDTNSVPNSIHANSPTVNKDTGENFERDKYGNKIKFEDLPDRSRHFLDAVSTVSKGDEGQKEASRKSGTKGSHDKESSERTDKSKHNGLVGRVPDSHDMSRRPNLENHVDGRTPKEAAKGTSAISDSNSSRTNSAGTNRTPNGAHGGNRTNPNNDPRVRTSNMNKCEAKPSPPSQRPSPGSNRTMGPSQGDPRTAHSNAHSQAEGRVSEPKVNAATRPVDPRSLHPAGVGPPRMDSNSEARSTPPLPRNMSANSRTEVRNTSPMARNNPPAARAESRGTPPMGRIDPRNAASMNRLESRNTPPGSRPDSSNTPPIARSDSRGTPPIGRPESRNTPPIGRPESRNTPPIGRSDPHLPPVSSRTEQIPPSISQPEPSNNAQSDKVSLTSRAETLPSPSSPVALNSDNKENSMGREKEGSVIHIPHSKVESERTRTERMKPVLSPCSSPISSPEDGLIIDFPGTPQKSISPAPRPDRPPSSARSPISCSPATITDPIIIPIKSPVVHVAKSPSPSPRKLKTPPVTNKSPAAQHSSPTSVQHNSPCELDDDLMDAALIL